MEYNEEYKITPEDMEACWIYNIHYFCDVLNGEYDVKTAREDIMSLIGSKYDGRVGG